MQDEHIVSGDYVMVEKTKTARNGEIVVALVDGSETTLKRFYKEGDKIRLQPANTTMQPIMVPAAGTDSGKSDRGAAEILVSGFEFRVSRKPGSFAQVSPRWGKRAGSTLTQDDASKETQKSPAEAGLFSS